MPTPISRDDAVALASDWERHRARQIKVWIDSRSPSTADTLRAEIVESFYRMLDSGELVRFGVDEYVALLDRFGGEFHDILTDESQRGSELGHAVGKLTFAFGRCYGATNSDMGIEEDNDGTCHTS